MKTAYEISHLLAGVMLVASFALLYQQRIAAVLNAFAAQSITLALAVAWAAWSVASIFQSSSRTRSGLVSLRVALSRLICSRVCSSSRRGNN